MQGRRLGQRDCLMNPNLRVQRLQDLRAPGEKGVARQRDQPVRGKSQASFEQLAYLLIIKMQVPGQFTLTCCSSRSASQEATSCRSKASSPIRRSRHCPLKTASSISAIDVQSTTTEK